MSAQPRPARQGAAATLVLALLLALGPIGSAEAAPSVAARVAALAGDVREADGHLYAAADDTGRTMDAAKITQAPDGSYLAVYHSLLADGRFHAAVATSDDLLHWTRRHDFGPGTHQASLAREPGGGYVLAYEKDPNNHIAVRGYRDLDALLAGRATRAYDAPRTLSRCAEGTPTVTAVHDGTVELTGHYKDGCVRDRQLRATLTDFRTWQAAPDHALDRALLVHGNTGNIGGRDPVRLDGSDLLLIEGQGRRGDFGTWRTYVYDAEHGTADRLGIRTHGGSQAFANPSATLIAAPDGQPALLMSVFVPSEGSAPGEAGQLLYWRTLRG
ncbi:hypothetical protein [Streptomyces sp. NBC_01304]|uniref:hypothetical protein n=1 Tax=Streptomyces sp. NBC_01304 TaxID=2903818 RepID=UPI002E0D2A86|nr:hypothetical protein OG430_38820 [Streptomyces sp. NBC_01304]